MADNATPRKYIYGIILFTLVIVAGISMLAVYGESNPLMTSGKYVEFNESMNRLDDISEQVGNLDSGIQTKPDLGAFGVLNALISSAWNSLKLLGSSLGFMTSAFNGLSTVFGVPTWVVGLIGLLVTVMIIFAIYSAIFQTEL